MKNMKSFSRHLIPLLQCSSAITHLQQIHSLMLKTSLDHNPFFVSQFILYASAIAVNYARFIFDRLPIFPPIFSWNAMFRGYAYSRNTSPAFLLFSEFRKLALKPDNFTCTFLLKACARSCVETGEMFHSLLFKFGFSLDFHVGNSLLIMYSAHGLTTTAQKVFDEMPHRDVVSWSSVIGIHVSCGLYSEALIMHQQMKEDDVMPNYITFVSLFSACAHLGYLNIGESFHGDIIKKNFVLDHTLGTALVNMYTKCGSIDQAFQVFGSMNVKNVCTWTVMISGFANHDRGESAISLFNEMEMYGIIPDSMCFCAILCACSHLGFISRARQYYDKMINIYNINPTIEHLGCMVDLFTRAGLMEEAYRFIQKMPMKPNSIILRSFLGAYRTHNCHFEMDHEFKKLLLDIEPELSSNYVITSNLFAASGNWSDVEYLRGAMKENGLKKLPGWSRVENR